MDGRVFMTLACSNEKKPQGIWNMPSVNPGCLPPRQELRTGTSRDSQVSLYFYCTVLPQEAKHMLPSNCIFKFGPNGDLFSKWLPILLYGYYYYSQFPVLMQTFSYLFSWEIE